MDTVRNTGRIVNIDLSARNEHSRGGLGLLVVFLPARVAGVHGDKNTESGLDDYVASFENDALVVSLQRLLDCHDLLAHHGQHLCFRTNRSEGWTDERTAIYA